MKRWPAALLEALRRGFMFFRPPAAWNVPVLVLSGLFCGLGAVVLHISNAVSYLSDDPKACVNCHIMAPQHATWARSSHARVATCNDCHVPHDNAALKYAFKAMDGTRHAFMFTFHLEPQVIQIGAAGKWAVQNNCLRCHDNLVSEAHSLQASSIAAKHGEGRLCWDCHRETPHGRVNGLAAAPYARVPQLSPAVPDWIGDSLKKNKQKEPYEKHD